MNNRDDIFFNYFVRHKPHLLAFRGQGEVVGVMTKMTRDQEHCSQPDITWHHNGISDAYTDGNSVISDKKVY